MEPSGTSKPVMKRCRFCAEEILPEASKCRYCGSYLGSDPNSASNEVLKVALGVTGSLLLVIASFAPIVTIPIIGHITLFQQGRGDGVILLIVALWAGISALFRRYGVFWISGSIGTFVVGNLFDFFHHQLPQIVEDYKVSTKGNIFGSIGEIALSNLNPDWGAIILLVGTIVSLGVAIWTAFGKQNSRVASLLGASLFVITVSYHALLFFVPYLKYWPSLLGIERP